jgi:hypothetical protein
VAEPDDNPTRPYPADEQPTMQYPPADQQPTEQYPGVLVPPTGSAPGASYADGESTRAPKRKRKRGRIVLVVLIVLALLLVIGYLVAERLIRDYAATLVTDEVVSALELPNDEGVTVDFGPASMLLQVISGSINTVNLDVDELTIGELTGSATVVGHNVPLAEGAAITDLAIDFTISEDNLGALVSAYSAGAVDSVGLNDGLINITTDVELLAFSLPVTLGLEPTASDGDLVFTPDNVAVNGATLTADEVRDSYFGSVAAPLLEPRSFCVAEQLPQSLVLTGVSVQGQTLVLTLDGAGTVLSEEAFAAKGSC